MTQIGIIFSFEGFKYLGINQTLHSIEFTSVTLTLPLGDLPIGSSITAIEVNWEHTIVARVQLRPEVAYSKWIPADGSVFRTLQFIAQLGTMKPTPGALNLGKCKINVGAVPA